jgi:hypothetical protein
MSIFDYENDPLGLQSNSLRVSLPDFRVSHQDSVTQLRCFPKDRNQAKEGAKFSELYIFIGTELWGDKIDHFDIETDFSVPITPRNTAIFFI